MLGACNAAVDELEREMLAGLTPHQERSLRNGLVSAVRALHAGFPECRRLSGNLTLPTEEEQWGCWTARPRS